MAQSQKGANGASAKVTKVSNPVGRPNNTVAAMKEEFARNDNLSKINFDKAQNALKQFRDPNTSFTTSMNSYTRDTIRDYLKNPASNENNLRSVAKYLYYRCQILYRLVRWYAGMWDLRCRNVEPTFDLEKGLDKNALRNYSETLKWLDIYNLQENLFEVFVNCYLYDTCYFLWFKDETGAIPYILDPSECKIVGRYTSGDLSAAIDMSKWRSKQRQEFVEYMGEPLKSMYNQYQRDKIKWVIIPDEYCGCFKFNIDTLDLNMPPFAPMFQTFSSLLDTEDLSAIKDKLDVYKMVILPMKTMKKSLNDFEVDPDLMIEYFEQMILNALPDYVSAAIVPGDGIDVVDFSSTSSDAQVDRVSNAQKNIFGVSGGGAVLNANNLSTSEAFKVWVQEETDFAISPLIGQVNGFTNRMLSYDVSNPCKVKHFEISKYTKKDFRQALLEACQYSFSYRMSLGTLYGISEKQTLASLHFEQEVLGLQNIMAYPLQSSYTSSNVSTDTDPIKGGRPEKDTGELSPSGERSRNK